ncbi:MAG TPA: AAA family ATPase [Candidatus Acidoferrales bacterium]|jgi:general secretion pathway protein A|nr:AAA family ATPase [Candidatus Acidoferrales bacterium]
MERTKETLSSQEPGFGNGHDTASDLNFLSFFGLRQNPFNVNPDPRFLFWTLQARKAFAELTHGVETGKSLIVLTGEVGTGKTTLINHMLVSLRQQERTFAFIFNSHLDIDDLFDFVLADFGIKHDPANQRNVRRRLNDWLFVRRREGDHPILIVDEAQGLSLTVLEEIRMLLNLEADGEKLIQIVLSGQPELDAMLRRPELRQFRQRISLRCKTVPLTIAETHDCVHHRLKLAGGKPELIFAPEALDALYYYSGGTPRVCNLLCEQALMNAYNAGVTPVPYQVVEEVAREFQFDDFKPFPRRLDFGNTLQGDRLATPPALPKSLAASAVAPIELPPALESALNSEPRILPAASAPVVTSAVALEPAPVEPRSVVNPVSSPARRAVPVAVPAPMKETLPHREPVPQPAMLRPERSMRRDPSCARAEEKLSGAYRLGHALQRIITRSIRWLREPMSAAHPRVGSLAGEKRS